MKRFMKGQKIVTPSGYIETVVNHVGFQIFTYENINGWYHQSNIAYFVGKISKNNKNNRSK